MFVDKDPTQLSSTFMANAKAELVNNEYNENMCVYETFCFQCTC